MCDIYIFLNITIYQSLSIIQSIFSCMAEITNAFTACYYDLGQHRYVCCCVHLYIIQEIQSDLQVRLVRTIEAYNQYWSKYNIGSPKQTKNNWIEHSAYWTALGTSQTKMRKKYRRAITKKYTNQYFKGVFLIFFLTVFFTVNST